MEVLEQRTIAARVGTVAVEVHADRPARRTALTAARLVGERRQVGLLDGRRRHGRSSYHYVLERVIFGPIGFKSLGSYEWHFTASARPMSA
jgi:hypothetical protein